MKLLTSMGAGGLMKCPPAADIQASLGKPGCPRSDSYITDATRTIFVTSHMKRDHKGVSRKPGKRVYITPSEFDLV